VVCHASTMVGKETKVGNQIRDLVVLFSIGIGMSSLVYSENTFIFLVCMGREEKFEFNFDNFVEEFVGGITFKLEMFHPFRFSVNMAVFSFILVVPILYHKIFNFMNAQNTSIKGMSKQILSSYISFISIN
jgi:hypothetical protein